MNVAIFIDVAAKFVLTVHWTDSLLWQITTHYCGTLRPILGYCMFSFRVYLEAHGATSPRVERTT
jgi:hypothetical protein